MQKNVLIVDDDVSFLRACESSLSSRYQIVTAKTVAEASDAFGAQKFAAVIVDYWLGVESAEHFLELVNPFEAERSLNVPCIVISGSADKAVAINLLNRRVFGLLEKPIQFETLVTTIDRAISSKVVPPAPSAASPVPKLEPGEKLRLRVDLERRQVTHGDSKTRLTPSEIKILAMLIEARGNTVGRDVFIRNIWGRVTVSRSALDTHILNLKKKIPEIETHIHAIYGSGYLLDLTHVVIDD